GGWLARHEVRVGSRRGGDLAGEQAQHRVDAGTADGGEEERRAPGGAGELLLAALGFLGRERIDLRKGEDFRLVGQAMAISGKLSADGPIGADRVVPGGIDEMQENPAALDMAEKAV